MALGKKTGGRVKGSKNKTTAAAELAAKDALKDMEQTGITPLAYMLQVMQQEIPADVDAAVKARMIEQRFEAAKAAAPYVHAKLATVEVGNKPGEAFKMVLGAIEAAI